MIAPIDFTHRLGPYNDDETEISKHISNLEYIVERLAGQLFMLSCYAESGLNIPHRQLLCGAIDTAEFEIKDLHAATAALRDFTDKNENQPAQKNSA